jgi:RNA polymerase sigma-70 factor (ECF subfamily)
LRTAVDRENSSSVPSKGSREDLRLVEAVLRKDRKATAEFVDQHAGAISSYLKRRLAPRVDLADDLAQEVFLAAWTHLTGFRGESSLRVWLLGIARHKVEDHYRSRLRERLAIDEADERIEETPASDPVVEEWLDSGRLEEKTRRTLEKLPEHYALVLQWRYWERRSSQEMAAATGRSEKAIERMLARAREQFKKRWNDE